MENAYRDILTKAILSSPERHRIISSISSESVTYEPSGVWVDPSAPGFTVTTTRLTNEELVRAYLLVKLTDSYGYVASPEILEIERVYKPVGRPTGKGGRVDVLVRQPNRNVQGMFFICGVQVPSIIRP